MRDLTVPPGQDMEAWVVEFKGNRRGAVIDREQVTIRHTAGLSKHCEAAAGCIDTVPGLAAQVDQAISNVPGRQIQRQ